MLRQCVIKLNIPRKHGMSDMIAVSTLMHLMCYYKVEDLYSNWIRDIYY